MGDVHNLVKVAHLRERAGREWTNADFVPMAVEMCTRSRVRMEDGAQGVEFEDVLKEVVENVKGPF